MRLFTGLFSCGFVLTTLLRCAAQAPDLLPDIPLGDITIMPKVFISGLPVAEEFVTEVFTQRAGPTDLAEIPDGSGRMLVTTYGGTVFLVHPSGTVSPSPFLQLADSASDSYNPNFEIGDAHGLTTLALHPDFAKTDSLGFGKFYTIEPEADATATPDFFRSVFITDVNHDEVLYEYSLADPSLAVCDSSCVGTKRELFRVSQPGWHHNLGDLAFDENNLLYVSSGDGSLGILSENAQRLDNIFGKILRIDPLGNDSANGAYGIPADNPFTDGTGDNVDEVFAYGLRNPYRIDFDQRTGDLFASETGENAIESVNRIVIGGNHGWNKKEGRFKFDRRTQEVTVDEDLDGNGIGDLADAEGFIEPILQYDHGDGRAIIGGILYRGGEIPGLNGAYVFAEFDGPTHDRGKLFYGDIETNEAFEFIRTTDSALLPTNIHSVNKDLTGNVYVLGIYRQGNNFDGVVLKIEPSPGVADFDDDNLVDCADAGLLYLAITGGENVASFDLNGDRIVDRADMERFLARTADARGFDQPMVAGDANLDGSVNTTDLNILAGHWQSDNAIGWCQGDFNLDGKVNANDLNSLALNWRSEFAPLVTAASQPVPEPAALWFFAVGVGMVLSFSRGRA